MNTRKRKITYTDFECSASSATESKDINALFGLLRMFYNTGLTGKFPKDFKIARFSQNKESFFKEATKAGMSSSTNELKTKKSKSFSIDNPVKMLTVKVSNGKVYFGKAKKYTLDIHGEIEDGTYTEVYLSFRNNTPILSINTNRVYTKGCISKSTLESRIRKNLSVHTDALKSEVLKLNRRKVEADKTNKELSDDAILEYVSRVKKIKLNLFKFINYMDKMYHIPNKGKLKTFNKPLLNHGENQAEFYKNGMLINVEEDIKILLEPYLKETEKYVLDLILK